MLCSFLLQSDSVICIYTHIVVVTPCPTLCDPMTVARQAPLSMGFPRQEYWSGLSFPSLGDVPDPGIELGSPVLQADSLPSEPSGKPTLEVTDPQIL